MQVLNAQIKRGIEENKRAAAEGKDYESGIAIEAAKQAKKTVKALIADKQKKVRALPKVEQTCKFYPMFCQIKGHIDLLNCCCAMLTKLKAEKDAAMAAIEEGVISSETKQLAEELGGTYSKVCFYTVDYVLC